jgi:hypothetical protein
MIAIDHTISPLPVGVVAKRKCRSKKSNLPSVLFTKITKNSFGLDIANPLFFLYNNRRIRLRVTHSKGGIHMNHSDHHEHTPTTTIYERLTGIKIGEQLSEWDARGKGYYGEYLLFSELYQHIRGSCKILMNLQIPSEHGRTTEIDLLLIHETGLYVFEAKHYKGTIYGQIGEQQWTQYFRTASNHSFPNPVLQNQWHITQLRKSISDLPIHSFIIFTSVECELKVTGSLPNTTLCYLRNTRKSFESISIGSPLCLTPNKIDEIFNFLKIFSPIHESPVIYDNNSSISFHQFLEKLNALYTDRMKVLEDRYAEKEYKLEQIHAATEKFSKDEIRKSKRKILFFSIIAILFSLLLVLNSMSKVQQFKNEAVAANLELQEFKSKWETITDFEIDGSKIKENFVLVDNVELKNSDAFKHLVSLSCRLTYNGEDFYVLIDKSSLFTIVLKDGRVIETPYYDSSYYSYALGYSSVYNTLEIDRRELSGFHAEDVAFIKLTNLQVKRIQYTYGEQPVLTNYEIILYSSK